MSSCPNTIANLPIDCNENTSGGVIKVLIAAYADLESFTQSGGTVSAITMASGTKFYEYNFRKNTANFTQPQTIADNGAVTIAPTIELQFNRMDVLKRAQMMALTQTTTVAIVKTVAGKNWLVGSEQGLDVSAGSGDAGRVKGDFNGFKVTLLGDEATYAYEVPEGLIADLLVAA